MTTNKLGLENAHYSFITALKHALKNIRQRRGRSIITGMGVLLGISFIISLVVYSKLVTFFDPTSNIAREQNYLIVVGVILCVVGITNSMYMEVSNRSSEIGTYLTLGSLPNHIIKLFLLEGLFIGLFSGIIGSTLGILIGIGLTALEFNIDIITQQINSDMSFYGMLYVGGIFVAILLTVVSSVLPARSASKMNPAEALRKV